MNLKRIYTWNRSEQQKKIPNWKSSSHDGILGFWFEEFTSINDRQVLELSKYSEEIRIPDWMTNGKATNIQEDYQKGTILTNR